MKELSRPNCAIVTTTAEEREGEGEGTSIYTCVLGVLLRY